LAVHDQLLSGRATKAPRIAWPHRLLGLDLEEPADEVDAGQLQGDASDRGRCDPEVLAHSRRTDLERVEFRSPRVLLVRRV
jgi:hypothetical protein